MYNPTCSNNGTQADEGIKPQRHRATRYASPCHCAFVVQKNSIELLQVEECDATEVSQ